MDTTLDTHPDERSAVQLLADATRALTGAGIDTARLDAEVLLAAAWGVDRTGVYLRAREAVPAAVDAGFRASLARRCAREPLQYIVGRQEFWSMEFVVTPDVLIPRPETELLVELASATVRDCSLSLPPSKKGDRGGVVRTMHRQIPRDLPFSKGGTRRRTEDLQGLVREGQDEGFATRLCDVGTGSGCVAVALARELPDAEIWALDISRSALVVAHANAHCHGVAGRVRCVESDLFAAVAEQRFDVIVSNPPYVSATELAGGQAEVQWEPRRALDGGGPAGLEVIERLLSAAPAHLIDGGWVLVEIGAGQGDAVVALARAAGLRDVVVRPDYAGLPRVVMARR